MATISEDIARLTPEALRDLARNGAARSEYRRAAAQRLVDLEHRHAAHPEVAAVLARGGYGEPSLEDFVPESAPEPEVRPESGRYRPDEVIQTAEGLAIVYDRALPVDESNLEEIEIHRGHFKASFTTADLMRDDEIINRDEESDVLTDELRG